MVFKGFILILLLISCGQQQFPDYSEEQETFTESGEYSATLKSLNPRLTGGLNGRARLWLRGNQFHVEIKFNSRRPHLTHFQYIHEVGDCPEAGDDLNHDRIISNEELFRVSGRILIPLDDKIKNLDENEDEFPTSDQFGDYFYSKSSSAMGLHRALRERRTSRRGRVASPAIEEKLSLEKRAIVIFTTYMDISIPVACGQIKLI